MGKIEKSFKTKTIHDFIQMQDSGHLNLEPSFQRESVWNLKDQQGLIQSILDGYPIPSIFLFERFENGALIYDVLDGKQRLEAIFAFVGARGFSKKGFEVSYRLAGQEEAEDCNFGLLRKQDSEAHHSLLAYEIQTTHVTGELSDIIRLFVLINSTGKALTRQEKAQAKYFKSRFLLKAKELAETHQAFFNSIISKEQKKRMKDVELVGELLASILNCGPIDKKKALDQAIANDTLSAGALPTATSGFNATIRNIENIFPDGLKQTRFAKISEFYSLFMVLWQLREDGAIVGKKTGEHARDALLFLTTGVDAVKILLDEGKGIGPDQQIFWQYYSSVREGTDSRRNRDIRAKILRQAVGDIFEQKDTRRLFTPEQRRLFWHRSKEPKCENCECVLTWENYHLDHIFAHSRGGRTDLSQAQMLCVKCNTSKGNR
jgi:hypothetical protein